MSQPLPDALRPWSTWLAPLDATLALALGALLVSLEPLLGTPRGALVDGEREPDGLGDLSRRGPYHRLLATEWALADEVPDEFLRRAASHEHLFLAPRMVSRRHGASLVAVFDAGPAQWGGPRLAHLALWILLARRAEALRTTLRWGIAQAPGELHDAGAPGMLERLLAARTPEPASDAHWGAWGEALAAHAPRRGERWQVGAGPTPAAFATDVAFLRRGFDDHLTASLGPATHRRTVRLPMPAMAEGRRLLEGRFGADIGDARPTRIDGRPSLKQPPVFSTSGEFLALPRQGHARLLQCRLPMDGREVAVESSSEDMPEATPLLALVLAGKRAGGLMADAHHLHPWRLGAFNAVPRPHASDFTLVPGRARWLEAALLNGGSGGLQRLLLHDGHGRVLSLEARQREASPPTLVERDALLLRALDDHHAVCVRRRDGLVEVLSLPCGGPPRSHLALTAGMPVQAAHVLAQRRRGGIDGALCLELRARSTRYLLQAFRDGQPLGERTELRVPEDWRVLGLVRQADDAMPALLALRDDRRGLAAISADGVHALQRCTHDVTSASVSIRGDRVALVTLGGELVVLDEGGRRVLARVAGSEA